MKKSIFITLLCTIQAITLLSQISFTNETSVLLSDTTHYSGCAMGIADMNGDGLDDIIHLNNAKDLYIEYQDEDGLEFSQYYFGSTSNSSYQWSMSIADVDSNGFNDVLLGGYYNGLSLIKADDDGIDYILEELSEDSIFLQGSNFADIDNNGTIDLFACHDHGLSRSYSNDGYGNLVLDQQLINTESTIPSDNSGNYGSVWTDYDNDGDLDMYLSKCRGGVHEPLDGRRVNMLFENDGNGNYTDVAEAVGLRPLGQSWATDFADVDNDGDLDCFIINHDILSGLYENNGDGTFTNLTTYSGMMTELTQYSYGIQCMFKDFDNDTYVDLLLTSPNQHYLFRNNGDFTFTAIANAFPAIQSIQSAVVGDLNNDGSLDLYAGFALGPNVPFSDRPDKIFINEGSNHNYFKVFLKGDNNNVNAIGSRIEIFGDWGVQVREIRAGESYGITNSFIAHFGLGDYTSVDSLIVRWPVGQIDKFYDIEINSTLCIEDKCIDHVLLKDLVIEADTSFHAIFGIEMDNVEILPFVKVKLHTPNANVMNNCDIGIKGLVRISNKNTCPDD